MVIENGLLLADVMHARQRPKEHQFRYKVYYLAFGLSDLHRLANKVLSLGRWNIFSFQARDHGSRDGSSLDQWIHGILTQHALTEANGDITLVTLPRIFGHVFNPVSFWFCFDRDKNLRAVLSEVNNTFGERHCYLSFHEDHRPIQSDDWLTSQKAFHVSPFLPVTGHYKFRFSCTEKKVRAFVNYYDEHGLMLATSISGNRSALSSLQLLRHFFLYPFVTLKVVALIHTEAIRLLMKGARYHSKPLPPTSEVTR